ncbi:hypothetical protein [Vreelandella titanicae]|uniref:hypothetical protein n=1 Tax=Vreelandella titanicae TaxID=664683 RepID=UPI0039BF803D
MAEVPLGVVPTPPAGAYERSLNSRSSLPRATDVHEVESVGFVARRKRQRTRESSAKRCRVWLKCHWASCRRLPRVPTNAR